MQHYNVSVQHFQTLESCSLYPKKKEEKKAGNSKSNSSLSTGNNMFVQTLSINKSICPETVIIVTQTCELRLIIELAEIQIDFKSLEALDGLVPCSQSTALLLK